jgi:hypothetical protein
MWIDHVCIGISVLHMCAPHLLKEYTMIYNLSGWCLLSNTKQKYFFKIVMPHLTLTVSDTMSF